MFKIEMNGGQALVTDIPVPRFQSLETIKGDWEHITARLEELKGLETTILLDIIYAGKEIIGDLRDRLDELTTGTRMEILRIKNDRVFELALPGSSDETLADLSIDEVFKRCLESHRIPLEQQDELFSTYREALLMVQEEGAGLETES